MIRSPVPWPCLMYHATPDATDDGASRDYFGVNAVLLAEQLRLLTTLGLSGVALESLADGVGEGGRVAITFDDAHVTNHRVALPLLRAHGATATVFVVSRWVGQPHFCSWSDLRDMSEAGWSIQSHTASHPFLSTLSTDQARGELRQSREEIEQHLGIRVQTIALPNGDFPKAPIRELLEETGYRWAATSRWGPNGDRELHRGLFNRYTVRRDTSAARFAEMASARSGPRSLEGLRLTALNRLRGLIGPSTYRRLRGLVVRSA